MPAHPLGYDETDLARLNELAGTPPVRPEEIRRVIDAIGYDHDWRDHYQIKSVTMSLRSPKITCMDSALLSYGLLELWFPETPRKLLAIHRRDGQGEECGHCVALFADEQGKIGSFSKSSFPGLGHRDARYRDPADIAVSYAEAYVKMGFTPLYFGVTTLEDVAEDLDWRCSPEPLNVLSERLQARYAYSFGVAA